MNDFVVFDGRIGGGSTPSFDTSKILFRAQPTINSGMLFDSQDARFPYIFQISNTSDKDILIAWSKFVFGVVPSTPPPLVNPPDADKYSFTSNDQSTDSPVYLKAGGYVAFKHNVTCFNQFSLSPLYYVGTAILSEICGYAYDHTVLGSLPTSYASFAASQNVVEGFKMQPNLTVPFNFGLIYLD